MRIRSPSGEAGLRLAKAFGTSAQYWLNLQSIHDLKQAQAALPAAALDFEACVA
jgi:plasmid maintenance system antidote protein VapI